MRADPRTRAQRRRDTEHRITHDKDVWVASALADGAPYLVPLSFDRGGEALLPSIATINVYNRLNAPTRQVAGAWGCSPSEVIPLSWNEWIRQIHRWVSIAFTVAVIIVTIVVFGQEEPAVWVSLSPLLPLALLLLTGLYLFVLPYATKWRSGRRTARET